MVLWKIYCFSNGNNILQLKHIWLYYFKLLMVSCQFPFNSAPYTFILDLHYVTQHTFDTNYRYRKNWEDFHLIVLSNKLEKWPEDKKLILYHSTVVHDKSFTNKIYSRSGSNRITLQQYSLHRKEFLQLYPDQSLASYSKSSHVKLIRLPSKEDDAIKEGE